MRLHDSAEAQFEPAFGIAMAALAGAPDTVRPGLAWGRVAVGGRSDQHRHDELETFVILQGVGVIHGDHESLSVRAGQVVEFAPFERHVIENTGQGDLLFLDIYWRDLRAVGMEPRATEHHGGPVFVFSTPPTPNGDLHLGHLAGPYLGADIYTRFQRMCGREAYHLTGSDDYQSYVESRAAAEGDDPAALARRYSSLIRETLALLDCQIDQFTETSVCDGYDERIRGLFARLRDSGAVRRSRSPALFHSETGAYLYEPYVSGGCPDCGARTAGNICEECGAPNRCHDLIEPRAATGPDSTGVVRERAREEIDLAAYRTTVLAHLDTADAPARVRELARRVLGRPETAFPVTHPGRWGVGVDPNADEIIWVWPEMAFGFLVAIEELGRRLGLSWSCERPSDDWKIVHFFGYDNSFYHTVLYPALYAGAFENWSFDIEYVVNEFYLLEHQKFSTSRRHAIWGRDVLSPDTVDPMRLHLALTRPESTRTNFSEDDFAHTQSVVFDDQICGWLARIRADLETHFAGTVPDAGDWTRSQIQFFNRLQAAHRRFEATMTARDFSARRAASILIDLVRDCRDFSDGQAGLLGMDGAPAQARTKTALEFCAAQLLTSMAGPLMPRFAAKLAADLGTDADRVWPDHVGLLPPGRQLPAVDGARAGLAPAV
jgi:methionyl-tRNA synthetase